MSKDMVLKYVSLKNGETLAYRESGTGSKLLLLIHGNTNSSKNWDLLIESLPEEYMIYAVDMRGFGDSSYNKPISSIKDLSDDIRLFVDALGLKGLTAAGWSAGGAVAMQFAADNEGYADKLILVESASIKGFPMPKRDAAGQIIPGELLKTREEIAASVAPLLQAYENKNRMVLRFICEASLFTMNKPPEERYEEYLDVMLKQRNLLDIDYALVTFNISHEHNGVAEGTGEVDRITIPTLIIQGDRDILVTMDMAMTNTEGIGKNAELVVIENSGHYPLVDKLQETADLFKKFIG
jgi:pimeloyl-ACP methyl ester carboxylesterase